jgi:hypothetical protein
MASPASATLAAPSGSDLSPFNTFLVAGDYAIAGVGVRGSGTGLIHMAGVPANANIHAAYLYWATLGDGQHGTREGNRLSIVIG